MNIDNKLINTQSKPRKIHPNSLANLKPRKKGDPPQGGRPKGSKNHKFKLQIAQDAFKDILLWDPDKKNYMSYEQWLTWAARQRDKSPRVLIEMYSQVFGRPEVQIKHTVVPVINVLSESESKAIESGIPPDSEPVIESYTLPGSDDDSNDT